MPFLHVVWTHGKFANTCKCRTNWVPKQCGLSQKQLCCHSGLLILDALFSPVSKFARNSFDQMFIFRPVHTSRSARTSFDVVCFLCERWHSPLQAPKFASCAFLRGVPFPGWMGPCLCPSGIKPEGVVEIFVKCRQKIIFATMKFRDARLPKEWLQWTPFILVLVAFMPVTSYIWPQQTRNCRVGLFVLVSLILFLRLAVLVFILCWTPYFVISAWWWFDRCVVIHSVISGAIAQWHSVVEFCKGARQSGLVSV